MIIINYISMVSTHYLKSRRADALALNSLIMNGAIHNMDTLYLQIITEASESPNGFAIVNGTCMVVSKRPNYSGKLLSHYVIHEL